MAEAGSAAQPAGSGVFSAADITPALSLLIGRSTERFMQFFDRRFFPPALFMAQIPIARWLNARPQTRSRRALAGTRALAPRDCGHVPVAVYADRVAGSVRRYDARADRISHRAGD
jgi:hypothetical protein